MQRLTRIGSIVPKSAREIGHSRLGIGFEMPDGSTAIAYWAPTDLMTTSYEGTLTLQVVARPGSTFVLVDPMDGAVYTLPAAMVKDDGDGCVTFEHLPVRDYPMLLCFDGFEK